MEPLWAQMERRAALDAFMEPAVGPFVLEQPAAGTRILRASGGLAVYEDGLLTFFVPRGRNLVWQISEEYRHGVWVPVSAVHAWMHRLILYFGVLIMKVSFKGEEYLPLGLPEPPSRAHERLMRRELRCTGEGNE